MASLDNYSFTLLVALFSLLGIEPLPNVSSQLWSVEKQWERTEDGGFLAVVSSRAVSEICNHERKGHIVFPQVYMAQYEILVGDQVVYTNSMSRKWHLHELQSRPVINCSQIRLGDSVEMRVTSYLKFFASLNDYPYIVENYPLNQIFYVDLFFIAAITSILLGIISTILVTKYGSIREGVIYLAFHISFSALVISHVMGKFFDLPIEFAHTLVVLAANFSAGFLIIVSVSNKALQKMIFIFLLIILSACILIHGYKNITHVFVILSIPIAMLTGAILSIGAFRAARLSRRYYLPLLYIVITVTVSVDAIRSQIVRDSFLHLSSIVLAASIIAFYHILEKVNNQKAALAVANSKLRSESMMIEKLNMMYIAYKEVIHDIKAPIMSLTFFLSDEKIDLKNVVPITSRLKNIVNRIDDVHVNRILDYYSVGSIISTIESIRAEKLAIFSAFECKIESRIEKLCTIFCDPVDIGIIVDEVFENSVKHGIGKVDVEIVSKKKFVHFIFSCPAKDFYPNSNPEITSQFRGEGLGLRTIRKKVELMEGQFSLSSCPSKFIIEIILRSEV